jgi:subtilisin family serine protease
MRPRIPLVSLWLSPLFLLLVISAAPLMAGPAVSVELPAAVAGTVPVTADGQIALFLHGRAQDALAARVRELGGRVEHRFQHAPILSVTVPATRLADILADPQVETAERQKLVRPAVADYELPGIGRIPGGMHALAPLDAAAEARPLDPRRSPPSSAGSSRRAAGDSVTPTFLGYDAITGAAQVWEEANHGKGTIVVVIDSGVYPDHPFIAGNVIGGENMVPAAEEQEIDFDFDGQPDGRAFDWNAIENYSHGTSVSALIAGHADLVLKRTDRLAQSLAIHFPECLIPTPEDTTRIAVRLLGTAPAASIYAIKVFPYDGGSSPDARVAAAVDHVIAMKKSGELATDVINMSLGGPTLWDGHNALDQLVDAATEAGITVVSAAGNAGPALITTGTPANAITSLTAGAASDPIHTRVGIEQLFPGPVGVGQVAYPYDALQVASFSGRGATADRRVKPDILATGFLNFTAFVVDKDEDGLNDSPGYGLGLGTSFAAPIVSGGAALLAAYGRSIGDHGRAPYIANVLLAAAQPIADADQVPEIDQGKGYLHLPRAFELLLSGEGSTGPPRDADNPRTQSFNLGAQCCAEAACPPLGPGETYTFVLRLPPSATHLEIDFPEVTLGDPQNPILGDQLEVFVHSAKRGGHRDYIFGAVPLEAGTSFAAEFPEPGKVRVTFVASLTNMSPVSGRFRAVLASGPPPADRRLGGTVARDSAWEAGLTVPPDLAALSISVAWAHNWTEIPTYDLDLLLMDPEGNLHLEGASLRSPEWAVVSDPIPGEWQMRVMDIGSTVESHEWFRVLVDFHEDEALRAAAGARDAADAAGAKAAAVRGPDFVSHGAAPNPARSATAFRFALGEHAPGEVAIRIYDAGGRLIRTLASGPLAAGEHALAWDGRAADGRPAARGIYLCRIEAPGGSATQKLVLDR